MEKELAYQIAHAELTKGQVRLAGYILKNQKRVLGMTALEVGREVGMSDASVIRFCQGRWLQRLCQSQGAAAKGALPAQRKDRQAFPV